METVEVLALANSEPRVDVKALAGDTSEQHAPAKKLQPKQFAKGREFEKEHKLALGPETYTEVRLSPLLENGKTMSKPNGKPLIVIIDALEIQDGRITLIEFKCSKTAPFTTNQKLGYDNIRKYGFEVKSKTLRNNKLGAEGKFEQVPIPDQLAFGKRHGPTEIDVVRPTEEGFINLPQSVMDVHDKENEVQADGNEHSSDSDVKEETLENFERLKKEDLEQALPNLEVEPKSSVPGKHQSDEKNNKSFGSWLQRLSECCAKLFSR